MSRIVNIDGIINKYKNYRPFTGNIDYDDGVEAGVSLLIEVLEDLPVFMNLDPPKKCGDCKFIAHYKHGPYARNPHSCCELIWFLRGDDYRVDEDKLDLGCPMLPINTHDQLKKAANKYLELLGE